MAKHYQKYLLIILFLIGLTHHIIPDKIGIF